MSETETQTPDPETEATEQDDEPEVAGTRVKGGPTPFEATLQASTFEDFLAPLDAIADEFRLQLTDDGFFVALVDPANVAMAVVELPAEGFETYRVDGDGGQIGLGIERLSDLLDFADADDLVSVALNPETQKLDVEFATTSASLACIDPGSVRRPADIPSMDLAVDVSITGKQFSRAVNLVDMVSDHLLVRGDPDRREWLVIGEGDTDDVEEAFDKDDLIRGQIPGEHETWLSVEYLVDLVKPIPKDAEVRIRHATEFPVKWEYEVGEAVSVRNMLAPRMVRR